MTWLIGVLMRTYRRSPLYPSWGKRLAGALAKVQRRRGLVVKTIGGITYELDLGETIDSSLYYAGTFEEGTERAITVLSKPGRVALDVGANIGYHTFRMARGVGSAGQVVAIEPMTRARTRLERNLALNPWCRNVTISPVGLSDAAGVERVAFQSSYRLDGADVMTAEDVRLVTLDELVDEVGLPRVDFMKVDVDGFEGKVFRGAVETLRRWSPDLVFEISPGAMRENGNDPSDLVRLLEGIGYEIRYEDGTPIEDMLALFDRVGDYSINLVAMVSR